MSMEDWPTAIATPSPWVAQPTATLRSSPSPVSGGQWEMVQFGEGVYAVCRRHCAGQWQEGTAPPDMVAYAREVARLNGLGWPDPALIVGQQLQMPPCPR
jgi:hypothetical protein